MLTFYVVINEDYKGMIEVAEEDYHEDYFEDMFADYDSEHDHVELYEDLCNWGFFNMVYSNWMD
jgi:hypothetical protein